MRGFVVAISVLLLFGCARFYAHDRGLEDRLKKAQQQFADVSTGQTSVWATMQANLDAAARRESEALRRDSANQRAATIAALDGLKWGSVKTDAERAAKAARDTLGKLETSIPAAIDEIDRLRSAIKAAAAAQAGSPEAEDAKKKVPKADGAKTPKSITDYVDAAEKFMAFVRSEVGPLVEGRDQAGTRKLLAVARKAKDQTLVKTIPELTDTITRQLKDPKTVALPKDVKDAAKRYLNKDFATFGELLDFFTAKDATASEVVLALEADFERTLLEIRRARLKSLEEHLRLLNAQLIVEQQRRVMAEQIAAAAPAKKKEDLVRDSLQAWFRATDDSDFLTGLRDLVAYVQLQGSMSTWSRMIANDLVVLDHRERVRLDEIASAAHARLASLGLQGATSFAQGGITEEQVANWLRALQALGIAVIGGTI